MATLEIADDDVMAVEPAVKSRPTAPPPLPSTPASIAKVAAPPPSAPAPIAPPVAVAPPPSAPASQTRTAVESLLDPTDALFEGMYDLNFVDSPWQAARVCAGALGRALRAKAVVIHTHDLVSHELRTIGAYGAGDIELLGTAVSSDDDLVGSAVVCNAKAVTMRFDGELPRYAPDRLGIAGALQTVVAVPGMSWGRCVAMIEIIDADERLSSRVADSASYVAERLADYLSARAAA